MGVMAVPLHGETIKTERVERGKKRRAMALGTLQAASKAKAFWMMEDILDVMIWDRSCLLADLGTLAGKVNL